MHLFVINNWLVLYDEHHIKLNIDAACHFETLESNQRPNQWAIIDRIRSVKKSNQVTLPVAMFVVNSCKEIFRAISRAIRKSFPRNSRMSDLSFCPWLKFSGILEE